eukprot:TRINITY_DN9284_c0_g3_i1.p1 TRINITY_DN9284_c0_g3~~TRINITY_DN9284_c0_g3_i1.p1  ORF type:complete len:1272 (+),score=322.90 TRINITY_DN9284_c0_g3_i1:102-3818(+)
MPEVDVSFSDVEAAVASLQQLSGSLARTEAQLRRRASLRVERRRSAPAVISPRGAGPPALTVTPAASSAADFEDLLRAADRVSLRLRGTDRSELWEQLHACIAAVASLHAAAPSADAAEHSLRTPLHRDPSDRRRLCDRLARIQRDLGCVLDRCASSSGGMLDSYRGNSSLSGPTATVAPTVGETYAADGPGADDWPPKAPRPDTRPPAAAAAENGPARDELLCPNGGRSPQRLAPCSSPRRGCLPAEGMLTRRRASRPDPPPSIQIQGSPSLRSQASPNTNTNSLSPHNPLSPDLGLGSHSPRARRRFVTASVVAVEYSGEDPAVATLALGLLNTAARKFGGRTLGALGGSAVAAWNIDQGSDPRHARQAALAAIALMARLRHELQPQHDSPNASPVGNAIWQRNRKELAKCGVGMATGSLSLPRLAARELTAASPRAGHQPQSPIDIHGDSILRARALAGLGPQLGCRSPLAAESVGDLLGNTADLDLRPVDLVCFDPSGGSGETVFELGTKQLGSFNAVAFKQATNLDERGQALMLLGQQQYAAAVALLTDAVIADPGDRQWRRMLRLAMQLERSPPAEPYCRRFRGFAIWEDLPEPPELPPDLPPAPPDEDEGSVVGWDDPAQQEQRGGSPTAAQASGGRLPLVDQEDVWLINAMEVCTDIGMRSRYFRLWKKWVTLTKRRKRGKPGKAVGFASGAESPRHNGSPRHSSAGAARRKHFKALVKRRGSALELQRQIRLRRPGGARAGSPSEADNDGLPREIVDRRGQTWHRSLRMLGKGAFGSVWVGMGTDGGLVAMKALPLPTAPPASERAVGMRRRRGPDPAAKLEKEINDLVSEVRLLTELRNDHIVSYFGSAVTESHVFIIMELLPGGCLAALLHQFGRLPVSSAVRYTKNIIKGLQFLHGQRIVHRDLKPGNVLLQIDGHCKLADFGASARVSRLQDGGFGTAGVIGTPMYMSPEQAQGHAVPQSDIWAVGITVIEMLTGKLPYDVDPESFIPSAHVFKLSKGEIVPRIPNLKPQAADFVRICLPQDPSARPPAGDLLRHNFLRTPAASRRMSVMPDEAALAAAADQSDTVKPAVAESEEAGRAFGREDTRPMGLVTVPEVQTSLRQTCRDMPDTADVKDSSSVSDVAEVLSPPAAPSTATASPAIAPSPRPTAGSPAGTPQACGHSASGSCSGGPGALSAFCFGAAGGEHTDLNTEGSECTSRRDPTGLDMSLAASLGEASPSPGSPRQ